MSFAVFGASPEEAVKMAHKRLKTISKESRHSCEEKMSKWKVDRGLSAVDQCIADIAKHGDIQQKNYEAAVQELAKSYLQKMAPKQISPIYGAPARCREFIDLAKRFGATRMQAKQRVRQPSTKKAGKFETSWQEVSV